MKGKKWYLCCYTVAALLVVGFVFKVLHSRHVYTTALNSAPFRLFVLVDGMMFLLPAAILALLGVYLHRHKR